MKVLLDTVVVLGLISSRDQYHRPVKLLYDDLRSRHATLLLPRIAYIELIGHATRLIRQGVRKEAMKQTRISVLESLISFGWEIADHTDADYGIAEEWWRRYADWPIDYPDALIAAAALRLKVDRVWTFDGGLIRFLMKAVPGIGLIRKPQEG